MKQIILLLGLFAVVGRDVSAATAVTNLARADRVLLIDPSTMPVAAGQATLFIGALHRTNGVYAGDYKLKVFPYFLKNDKGQLAIVVSDATLAQVSQGKIAAITGTATTAKSGKTRHIEATATPTDANHGRLRLWFTAGGRKMIFEPAYHFAGDGQAAVPAPAGPTNLAVINL